MASNIYNSALANLMSGALDLDTNDVRIKLLMTNTTADTDKDAINTVSNITTLDVCDASGYADVALTGETVAAVDATDKAKFDAADASFTGLGGNATRDYQGVLIYKYVDGTAANDIPIAFIDFTADVPKTATQVNIPWDSTGILLMSQA